MLFVPKRHGSPLQHKSAQNVIKSHYSSWSIHWGNHPWIGFRFKNAKIEHLHHKGICDNAYKTMKHSSHGFCPFAEPMPLAPPNYRVRLFHGNSTITYRLYHTLQASLHSTPLQEHVKYNNNWPTSVFHLINWDAQELFFCHLTRNGKICTLKIIHSSLSTHTDEIICIALSHLCAHVAWWKKKHSCMSLLQLIRCS